MASRYLITGGGSVVWDAVDTSIWSATSGGATGASVPGVGDDVIMDGSSGGGTVTLGYSPTVNSISMGAFTGTFDGGGYSPTMATLGVSGTGARTLTMGAGTWTLTGNAATIFSMATTTNLTFNKGNAFVCNYSGSTGTRTINNGTSSLHYPDFNITAGSDTVVITASTTLGGLNFTGFTGTWTNNSFSMSGNLTLGAGMTVGTGTGTLTGIGQPTGGNSFTITTNGKTIDFPINLASLGGFSATWTLQDAFTLGSTRTLTLTAGTLDTNGQTCSWGLFASANANTRVLTLGASQIALTGTNATVWAVSNGSGGNATALTLNAGTSTITLTGTGTGTAAATFDGGGKTYNNVVFNGVRFGVVQYTSTFANLTFNGIQDFAARLVITLNQTVTGTFTCTGFSSTYMPLVLGAGTAFYEVQRTITVGSVNFSNVNFRNIAISGVTATGTRLGNAGNNSGITFDSSRALFWSSATGGNFSNSANWSLTSGGATGVDFPLPQDSATFDANSLATAGQTVTMDPVTLCGDLSFASCATSPTLTFRSSAVIGNFLYGSITLKSGMTITGSDELYLNSTSASTITSAGNSFSQNFVIRAPFGSYTLQDALTVPTNRTFQVEYGTFSANGYNVTCGLFSSSNAKTRVITMGSGTWTLTGTGTVFNTGTVTGLTFSGASATIYVTDTSSALKTLALGTGVTPVGTLRIAPGGTGPIAFSNGGTRVFTTVEVTGPKTIVWQSARTYQATNFTINSSIDRPVTFLSDVPGTQYTLSVASGTVGSRFMSIFDCLGSGGATFVARESYGNNTTGWTIVPPRINQALASTRSAISFPNNTAYVAQSAVNSGISPSGSFSLLAWIDPLGLTGTRQDWFGVTLSPTNNSIGVFTDGKWVLSDPIGTISSTARVNIGRMTPVVITWDSTNARGTLYADGFTIYTRTGTAVAFTDGIIVAGRFPFSASLAALGNLGYDARIYGRELTAAEVMAWSRNGTAPAETNLLASYDFSAGSGVTVADTSGNGRNLTITSAPWVTDRPYTARVAETGRSAAVNRVQL